MNADIIAEIGIDSEGRLYVCPATQAFPFIYREAMEVHWEPSTRRLHSFVPREWTYLRWFEQIIRAAAEEACELRLSPATAWVGVPDGLRTDMERWLSTRATA